MAAEKRPPAPHRGTDVGGDHLSIEEKYDEVRQLINIGKEKGYLLYDEVNELLPSEITSSDELDDLFNTFGSAGIEVIDSDQKYLRDEKTIDRTGEGAEELELDLTPGALDKTNDPVRMYLREMGTVPLLTREGEVEIARRIERGQNTVLKSLFRAPLVIRDIIAMGDEVAQELLPARDVVQIADPMLNEEASEEKRGEFVQAESHFRRALQRPVAHFCYPNGKLADYDERAVAAVRRAGYRTAFNAESGMNGPAADPVQQKVFMIMPLVMSVTFAFFPAGLVLYWVTNTILSIAQQWNINRRIAAAAAAKKN